MGPKQSDKAGTVGGLCCRLQGYRRGGVEGGGGAAHDAGFGSTLLVAVGFLHDAGFDIACLNCNGLIAHDAGLGWS